MKTLFLLFILLFLILGLAGGASIFYLSKTSEFTRITESAPPRAVPRATPVPGR
ncbi:MAG: hypothetical protein ACSHX7_07575 [Luteolibacter sp.]